MEKKVIVAIKSFSDVDTEAIEVVTPGMMVEEDGMYKVTYEESELSGMDGTTTVLNIYDNSLILERVGSTSTRMEFIEKEDKICLYNTPYGMLNLSINTERVEIDMCDKGGVIYIKYAVGTDGQTLVNTHLNVEIKS